MVPSVTTSTVVPLVATISAHQSTFPTLDILPPVPSEGVQAVDGTGSVSKVAATGAVKSSVSQRASEYALYMTQLPKLCASDRSKLKAAVEEELGFQSFKDKGLAELNLASRAGKGTPILDNFSLKSGVSLKFLYPPVLKCLLCHGNLHVNNSWNFKGKPPTQVKVHTMTGPEVYSKVIIGLSSSLA